MSFTPSVNLSAMLSLPRKIAMVCSVITRLSFDLNMLRKAFAASSLELSSPSLLQIASA